MRLRHFCPRTNAYLGWMRRYHEFHGRRDPSTLGSEHLDGRDLGKFRFTRTANKGEGQS